MTHPPLQDNPLNEIVNLLSSQGTDALAQSVRVLLNHAMKVERSQVLQAEPYQRTAARKGYSNGFKPKTLQTRLGEIQVAVPQVRGEVDFYPSALERGQRTERALTLAIAEMYVQGVSTRRVSAILSELAGGLEISAMQVSRAAAELDQSLALWRNRNLHSIAYPYLILDARYEKVRRDGSVLDSAVLFAIGVDASGTRTILGVSTALSEAHVHWGDFLASLLERGLGGVRFIVSDDHPGLRKALAAYFPAVPWQRCQFHLQQNAIHYVPKLPLRPAVAAEIREIFDAQSRPLAEALLHTMVAKYAKTAPELARWLEQNLPEGFTVFSLPKEHRKRLRTSNAAERVNQELKRRTRVVRIFPNPASLLRLVSALLCDISEHWDCVDLPYLSMNLPPPIPASPSCASTSQS
jgi:transposase-like protein